MRTSQKGLALIKSFEGCELKAYQCPAGVWTIGYGHTENVHPDASLESEEAATRLLMEDLMTYEFHVQRLVRINLSQGQFDALVSFTYNLGAGSLASSTLLKLLNVGDTEGAAQQFPRWNRAKGKVLAGLTRRRLAEQELFLS